MLVLESALPDELVDSTFRHAMKWTFWRTGSTDDGGWGQGRNVHPSLTYTWLEPGRLVVAATWLGDGEQGAYARQPGRILFRRWVFVRLLRRRDRAVRVSRQDAHVGRLDERALR